MVQSCLLLRGDQENQSEGTSLPSGGGEGGFINPVLALQKTMERSTMLFSWVNPLFRLGHFQVRFLYVYQRVPVSGCFGMFLKIPERKSI